MMSNDPSLNMSEVESKKTQILYVKQINKNRLV